MPEDYNYWKERTPDDERKDWEDGSPWIEGYWNSKDHPHRQAIMKELEQFEPLHNVFEVGCNSGPNLALVKEKFLGCGLAGIDANQDAVQKCIDNLVSVDARQGSANNLFPPPFSQDAVIADACLMYVPPEEINAVADEMVRITRKGIIIVDWYDDSVSGVIKDFHWARNYKKLFEERGARVEMRKLTEQEWPSKNWQKHGHIFVCRLA